MPPARVPPTLGGLSWYWSVSSSSTAHPSPWNRPHSASRAEVVSVPGAVRTPPIDQVSHSRKTTITTPTRRTQYRRRLGRYPRGGRGRRRFLGVLTCLSLRVASSTFLLYLAQSERMSDTTVPPVRPQDPHA